MINVIPPQKRAKSLVMIDTTVSIPLQAVSENTSANRILNRKLKRRTESELPRIASKIDIIKAKIEEANRI